MTAKPDISQNPKCSQEQDANESILPVHPSIPPSICPSTHAYTHYLLRLCAWAYSRPLRIEGDPSFRVFPLIGSGAAQGGGFDQRGGAMGLSLGLGGVQAVGRLDLHPC